MQECLRVKIKVLGNVFIIIINKTIKLTENNLRIKTIAGRLIKRWVDKVNKEKLTRDKNNTACGNLMSRMTEFDQHVLL